ncbi:MAG: hypothetical protein F6K54_13950 [Okeania sp. SIO3B5]|uniref:hypothetical protein n=1 Tax=Okeania sp. SIO3B5 TaxID=2607811 RepID=UPI00140036AF|nr:hypothetical protein [Okeania sp. SIO3B5]NEO54085.1 hypothetical protein [Okeania sp. SIO3B5]
MTKTGKDGNNTEANKKSKPKDRLGSKDTLIGGDQNDTIKMCYEEDLPYDSLESSDIDSESRQIWSLFGSTDPQATGKFFVEGDHSNDTLKSGSNFDAELYETWLSLHNIMAKNLRSTEKALENDCKPPSEP